LKTKLLALAARLHLRECVLDHITNQI